MLLIRNIHKQHKNVNGLSKTSLRNNNFKNFKKNQYQKYFYSLKQTKTPVSNVVTIYKQLFFLDKYKIQYK